MNSSRLSGGSGTDDDRKIRILIADDHPEVRIALNRMFSKRSCLAVIGEVSNGREAVEACRRLKPDVVVMDVSMPEMNGIEATRRITEEQPEVRVLGLSMYEDEPVLQRMMENAGAKAFIVKSAPASAIRKAVLEVASRED